MPSNPIFKKRDEEEHNCTTNIDKVVRNKNIIRGEIPEKPRMNLYGLPKYWGTKTTAKWVQTTGCPKGKVMKGQGQNFAIIAFQDEVCMHILQSSIG